MPHELVSIRRCNGRHLVDVGSPMTDLVEPKPIALRNLRRQAEATQMNINAMRQDADRADAEDTREGTARAHMLRLEALFNEVYLAGLHDEIRERERE